MDRIKPASNNRSIKRIALIASVVVLLVIAGVALASIDFSTTRVDRNKISIETVQRGTLEVKVSANGQLVARNIEQIVAQVTGRVSKRYVQAGDVVSAGQVLVELTNPQLLDSKEEASSAWEGATTELNASEGELQTNLLNEQVVLTQAQFNLGAANLQLEAQSKLIGKHIIAEIDYKRTQLSVAQLAQTLQLQQDRLRKMRDNIKLELAVRRTRVAELARALDRAKNQVANLAVAAGISGIVQSIGIDVGQQLEPGNPIGRIAKPDDLYAELKVPAREANDVKAGQNVVIDTRSGTVNGTVTRVDPAVIDGTVIVDADLKDPLPTVARPQLPVEGIIFINQLPDTLYVGKPSYVKSNAAIAIFKLDAGGHYATRVTVEAGKLSLNYMQVLHGLSAGDRIITSDSGEWRNQQRILIR